MNTGTLYSVLWKTTPRGVPFMLDFEDGEAAGKLAANLTEQGRIDVTVTGPQVIDLSPEAVAEMSSAREKLWARVAAKHAEDIARLRLSHKADCEHCRYLLTEAVPS